MSIVGIAIVSVLTYWIGRVFFALVGNRKGFITSIVWGCLFLATLLSGNIALIIIYLVISVFIYGR